MRAQNDYYGSNYASFPLRQFLQWTRNESATPRYYDGDSDDEGSGGVRAAPAPPAEAQASTRQVPIASSLRCHLLVQAFADEETESALLAQSSSFSIDVNPRLVLSSEELVETLITSGVGQYLEFTAVQHTYVHLQPEAATAAPSSEPPAADTVWEVPCAKKDVFQSKLLGMVEKRQLMKFLQFVADYGETHIAGEDVGTKNERSLALGRALKRPQNKTNQAADDAIAPYLDEPFQALLEKHFKLSSKLQQVVVYCVGLASFPAAKNQISGREGLAAVYRYVASIGRFTSTAFLVPLYGVSEITQSFCRLCAVYGGIYVLRAPIESFLLDKESNEVVGIRASGGGTLRAKHFIVNGSYVDAFGKATLQREHTHGQILRGVFVLRTSLRREMARLMIVIPPEDPMFGNPFAIQVVQLDAGACVCPRDLFLVQLSMTLPGEWLDDRAKQQALVYAVIEQLITSALAEKTAAKSGSPVAATDTDEEVGEKKQPTWEDVVAYRAIYTMDHLASTNNSSSVAQKSAHLPANLWPCETRVDADADGTTGAARVPVNPLEIHLESASANARAIFDQLCPGEDFLPKSASAEQAEKEALEDEHGAVLQAAQKLAEQATVGGDEVATHDSSSSQAASERPDGVDSDAIDQDSEKQVAGSTGDALA